MPEQDKAATAPTTGPVRAAGGESFAALQQAMKPSGCARVAAVLAAFSLPVLEGDEQ